MHAQSDGTACLDLDAAASHAAEAAGRRGRPQTKHLEQHADAAGVDALGLQRDGKGVAGAERQAQRLLGILHGTGDAPAAAERRRRAPVRVKGKSAERGAHRAGRVVGMEGLTQ